MGGKAGRSRARAGGLGEVTPDKLERQLRGSKTEVVLESPQSVDDLLEWKLSGVDDVILRDPDPRYAHLNDSGRRTMYRPSTHHDWVGVFNEALRIAGDARRFVAIQVDDPEEPLYWLVTDERRRELEAGSLLAYDTDDIELPRATTVEQRARDVAALLRAKHLSAEGAGEEVALTIDLNGLRALLARLREDLHHDARVGILVREEYQ